MNNEVTHLGMLDMQVCVQEDMTDTEVIAFAQSKQLCGTENGWQIRQEGDPALSGDPERMPCDDREGYVHIILDA